MIKVAPQLRKYTKQELLGFLERGIIHLQGDTLIPTISGAAAPPLANNFNGGTNGNAIANTDTGSGDQWNTVTTGTGATITYDNAVSRGAECMKIVQPATYANTHVAWSGLGSITSNVWFRMYVYLPVAVSGSNLYICSMRNNASGGNAFLQISTSNLIQYRNAADAFVTGSSGTLKVPLNQWFRLEWRVLSSTTVGEVEWWMYTSPDATVAADSKLVTGQVLAANMDIAQFGNSSGPGPVSFTSYFDEIAVSTAGRLGPTGFTPPSDSLNYAAAHVGHFGPL